MRIWLELACLLILAGIIAGTDLSDSGAFHLSGGKPLNAMSKEEVAQELISNAEHHLPDCYKSISGAYSNLTKAIATVEFGARSRIESVVEMNVLRFSIWLGTTPPDWSYGVMQIRPSTALNWMNNKISQELLWQNLVDDCSNIALGQKIIENIGESITQTKPPNITQRITIVYNGQGDNSINNFIYNQIVHAVYNHYVDDHFATK